MEQQPTKEMWRKHSNSKKKSENKLKNKKPAKKPNRNEKNKT